MRPNGRNRNDNPSRNRDYIEEADENTQRDYQNYGSEYDESETGSDRPGGGRYGSAQGRNQSQSQQYPPSGYYNRYDEPRRAQNSSDENYRDYGRSQQGSDEWSNRESGSGSRSSRNQGYGQGGNFGPSSNRGSNQGFGRSGGYDQGNRPGRENQQDLNSEYYYGRGNYAPQYGSGWRENPSYSPSGMGYGDAEEQGRLGNRGGSQQSERQGRHFGKGPKGYQRSDERIKEDVNEALSRHWDVDASDIEVQVQNGEVTLTGSVDSRESKRYAEDAAERCFGVKDVENKLKVKKESGAGSSSSWSSEIDTGSSSGRTGAKSSESTSMGDVRKGAGSTSGSTSGSGSRS